MTLLPPDLKMKPVIILPPGAMKAEDQASLRENGFCVVEAEKPELVKFHGFCVVEAEKPELVKFLDPIPAVADRTAIENAAIQLSRRIMSKGFWHQEETRRTVIATYFDCLVHGTPLDPAPSQAERERKIFDEAKADELQRLAREEAKAERAAARAAKKSETQ